MSIIFLWPLSALYLAVYFLRRGCYRFGIFKFDRVKLPIICIGNITAGGTGKSPFCIMLAERLHSAGYKPAVISRGYKRNAGDAAGIIVASDWQTIRARAEQTGDEPFLMAKKLLGRAVVIVSKNRAEAAIMAEKIGADIIIMDDGFQHWQLYRDYNIVLLDSRRPLNNGWLLPVGRLREPVSALSRADIIIATRYDDRGCHDIEKLLKKHHYLNQPFFYCRHQAVNLRPMDNHRASNTAKLTSGSKLLLFSGIARPDSFESSVKGLGYHVSRHITFGDHHSYNRADLERISKAAKDYEAVITTEKDAVKLPEGWDPGKPLMVLEIEISFQPATEKEKFLEIIKGAIKQ